MDVYAAPCFPRILSGSLFRESLNTESTCDTPLDTHLGTFREDAYGIRKRKIDGFGDKAEQISLAIELQRAWAFAQPALCQILRLEPLPSSILHAANQIKCSALILNVYNFFYNVQNLVGSVAYCGMLQEIQFWKHIICCRFLPKTRISAK